MHYAIENEKAQWDGQVVSTQGSFTIKPPTAHVSTCVYTWSRHGRGSKRLARCYRQSLWGCN